jgi:aspartate/glutamate racemase
MTKLLERAVKKVRTLPDSEQDAIAALILEELEDEARWDKSFARTQDVLARLADEAMAEDHAGKTEALDPDRL